MIQLTREYFDSLDDEKIKELVDLAEPYFTHRKNLYKRYRRKESPNEIMSSDGDRIVVAFESYIVGMARGYLSGKPPAYSIASNDDEGGEAAEEYQAHIDKVRRYNDDAATFSELIHDYVVTGAAYLYVTENENNEVVYTRLDSRSTVCVYDYGTPPYPIAMLRVLERDGGRVMEVVTEKSRRMYHSDGKPAFFEDFGDNGEIQEMTEKELHWNDVPVAAFENPDNLAIFEPAIGLIDTYENLMTNVRSMTKYNDNAKLLISGYQPENPMFVDICDKSGKIIGRAVNPAWKQEEKELYEASALFLRDGASASWLLKNVDYGGVLELLRHIEKAIATTTTVPSAADLTSPNASGVALGYSLYSLDQYAATVDRVFKKGYLRLWEIVTNRLNLKNGTDYDFRAVDIHFSRNVPTDRDASINRAKNAYEGGGGIVSLETAIGISGIEVDGKSEVSRIDAERTRISGVGDIIDLRNNQLMDEETALGMLYPEELAGDVLTRLGSEFLGADYGDEGDEASLSDKAGLTDGQGDKRSAAGT